MSWEYFFKDLFTYFNRERESVRAQAGERARQRETRRFCAESEPDWGFNPTTLRIMT